MQDTSRYDARFFRGQQFGSAQSAAIVIPLILNLFPNPLSVIDVGCGVGGWLAEFQNNGVTTIKGVDGGAPDLSQLKIPVDTFERVNLIHPPKPTRRYDIALSLEVAEHLPPTSSTDFIRFLCALSDVVVFSAALPGQRGTDHINEQPLSYWATLFSSHGYDAYDILRPTIWNDDRIEWWYRQNIFVAAKPGCLDSAIRPIRPGDMVDVVHPQCLRPRKKPTFFLLKMLREMRAKTA